MDDYLIILGSGIGSSLITFLILYFWTKKQKELREQQHDLDLATQLGSSRLQQQSLEESKNQLAHDLEKKRIELVQLQNLYQQEQQARTTMEERTRRLTTLEALIQQQEQEIKTLYGRNAELKTQIDQERLATQEKLELVYQAEKKLTESFKALSAEALSQNNRSFLALAHSSLEKYQVTAQMDLKQRQQSIVEMINPITQVLAKVDGRIGEIEKERVGSYESLMQVVKEMRVGQQSLSEETRNLVKALRAPTVRGQWGEMQLRRVVEISGMLSHCDFLEQVSAEDQDRKMRPDMVVNLPGNKNIIVDAKAPLSAYLEALEAPNDDVRKQKMVEHSRQVRLHIRALSQRAYWDQFQPTPEFVVLFLPGETFFSAALEHDPSLIEVGVKERVILATPTTLIALLRAVAYGWRQESMAENARHIGDLGREIYKRLADLGNHMARMGRSLGQVVDAYNNTVGTLERRVLVTARKFHELKVAGDTEELAETAIVEATPRKLQALELSLEDIEEPLMLQEENLPPIMGVTLTSDLKREETAIEIEEAVAS